MTMCFSIHDSIDSNGVFDRFNQVGWHGYGAGEASREKFPIVREKITMPETRGFIERPRINNLLRKSLEQFPATLITGRSGTGKTALAAGFAAEMENVSWYTAESTDAQWPVFSRYFSASLCSNVYGAGGTPITDSHEKEDIARFLANRFSTVNALPTLGFSLIVLEDIHHIFDAPWFDYFFNLLLYSLPQKTHVLLLCRSKPPGPLWRLRSKQMLNVMDEKVIAFDADETEALFNSLGLSASRAKEASRQSFGRVSKLMQLAGNLRQE